VQAAALLVRLAADPDRVISFPPPIVETGPIFLAGGIPTD